MTRGASPSPPVARRPMRMGNGDDLHVVPAHAVDQCVWVAPEFDETVLIVAKRVRLGILRRAGHGGVEGGDETLSGLLAPCLVPGQRFDEFEIGRRRQSDFSHPCVPGESLASASLPPTRSASPRRHRFAESVVELRPAKRNETADLWPARHRPLGLRPTQAVRPLTRSLLLGAVVRRLSSLVTPGRLCGWSVMNSTQSSKAFSSENLFPLAAPRRPWYTSFTA